MLKIENLCVSYGGIKALRGISLEVPDGKIVTLIGANGAGKSTTLRTISGLVKADSGSITYDGQELLGKPINKILEAGIAQSPEGRRVFANLTVLENLKAGAYLRKDKDGIEKDIKWVYELFPRLEERNWQLAGTLSGGEQQMLAVGRALMSRPKLLMLDEPSLGLAPLVVQGIFDIIRTVNEQGVTVLLIEQNANMALKIADYAYVLETGNITKSGTGAELLADGRQAGGCSFCGLPFLREVVIIAGNMTEKAVCAVEYAMMGLAALAGGVIQPLTGFGAAVIMMVAASAFYDMTIAPTIVALICMAQSGTMTWMYRKHIDVKQIALPIGLYTVCSLVIINLLGNFDLHVLTALFGAFLIALAAYFLLFAKRVKLDQPGLAAGLVCSAFSGCCAGAFTIGGPMMALYFVAIARSKETYVGNMQFLFFTTNLVNFTMRTVRGYFSAALLPMAGLGMVCILLGLWIGTRLSRKMSGDVARQVVYIGVGVSGLVTLVQELMK